MKLTDEMIALVAYLGMPPAVRTVSTGRFQWLRNRLRCWRGDHLPAHNPGLTGYHPRSWTTRCWHCQKLLRFNVEKWGEKGMWS